MAQRDYWDHTQRSYKRTVPPFFSSVTSFTFNPNSQQRLEYQPFGRAKEAVCMCHAFRMLEVHLGQTHLYLCDTIVRVNLQYADSIIIKKIGSIPEERGPNRK